MEAANRGAKRGKGLSIGLNIQLPEEQLVNRYQDKSLHFKYFFARKVMFVKYAAGYVIMPADSGRSTSSSSRSRSSRRERSAGFPSY